MGEVMKPLAGSPVFVDLMGKVSSIPVLGVVLGAVMTIGSCRVVQLRVQFCRILHHRQDRTE